LLPLSYEFDILTYGDDFISVNWILTFVSALLIAKWIAQIWMEQINRKNVEVHAGQVPEAFRDVVDDSTYRKSVAYTLAKGRFRQAELTFDAILLAIVLFSGFLPWVYDAFVVRFGDSMWTGAAFFVFIGIVLSVPGLPFDWYGQFRLEERFGFNTMTTKLWVIDRIKGTLLAIVIGYPLLVLILKLVQWTGELWWLWAWAVLLGFQLLMVVLAPVLIMPLFNKFTPLPEGSLRERLLKLAERTGFHARSIQVMDGSKRSRHSNAFFTGFKRFRKIVLFDTLIQQLNESELEAVLAHEIGHYKKGHIPKMLTWSAISMLGAFYLISVLAENQTFYEAFGFHAGSIVPALLLFSLLGGIVSFWFSPIAHWWSRKFEYEADAYAADAMQEPESLVGALRKLNEKNLSNLTPHPVYSRFYYSHPTLLERERALRRLFTRISESRSSNAAGAV
jgi:STE24 endopeptidase